MSKFTKLLIFGLLLPARLFAANIYIIDDSGYNMDTQWQTAATSMGHTATIQPLTSLNVNTWFPMADALIVSSGVYTYTAAQIATIQAFVQSGKPAYIQGEYQSTYMGNQGFSTIVNALGGVFTWGATQGGNLIPTVTGTFATTNNAVPTLPYFWYGVTGTGNATVVPFIDYNSIPVAWSFCPPGIPGGKLIMTTDQDWINQSATYPASILLMQNIITHLLNPGLCGNTIPVITGTVTSTNVSCFGGNNGTATVTPTSGVAPYSFLWSPSGGTAATATGLAAGNYACKITDSYGDTGTVFVTITQPAQITSSFTIVDAGCTGGNNGSAAIAVSGGTPSYTYSWAPSGGTGATSSGLAAGTYTCTVTDANGCIHTATATVAEPVITAQPANISVCEGGGTSFGIIVTGGIGLNYQWQLNTGSGWNDISNGGIYSGATTNSLVIGNITLSMNGYEYRCRAGSNCLSNSNAAILTVKPVPALSSPLSAGDVCSNSPFAYTPSATLPGTAITWSRSTVTGISNAPATGTGSVNETLVNTTSSPVPVSYAYTLSLNGCLNVQPVTVVVNPQPVSVITPAGTLSSCDTLTLAGNTGPSLTYQWIRDAVNIPGAVNSTYLATSSGVYELIVTNQYNCSKASAAVNVNIEATPSSVITYNTPLTFCEGNFVLLSAPDAGPVTYTWYLNGYPITGATNDNYAVYQSGVYSVRKTTGLGCTSLSPGVTVTVFPILNPIISRNGNVLSTTGFTNYQWFMNNAPIPGATTSSITITQNAYYQVQGTDANGCISKSAIAWIEDLTTGIGNIHVNADDISIYPNPAKDILLIESPIAVNASIRNMKGQVVMLVEDAKTVDVSSFAEGMYMILLSDKTGMILKNEKFVKTGN